MVPSNVPNAVAAGDLAGTIVQGPLIAAQSSLSGERPCLTPALLSQLFMSPSLDIDSEKLRAKIWIKSGKPATNGNMSW